MTPLLELVNLSVIRQGRSLLKEITLSIYKGTTNVVMGVAGAGKTTFLKSLSGLLIPDKGQLLINGKDFATFKKSEIEEFRKINGFVFQDAALWANRTIEENLAIPLQYHYPKMSNRLITQKIDFWIERTGFWDSIKNRPAAYSMGENKMISLIRALITDPAVCFMDSPTQMIDYAGSERIIGIIKELKQRKATQIIISDTPEIVALADNLIIIDNGEMIEYGQVDSVLTSDNERSQSVLSRLNASAGIEHEDLLELVDLNQKEGEEGNTDEIQN